MVVVVFKAYMAAIDDVDPDINDDYYDTDKAVTLN